MKIAWLRSDAMALLCGCMALGLACVLGCADSSEPHKRAVCRANLEEIYARLVRYVEKHGEVPADEDGKFSLDPLFQEGQSGLPRCPNFAGEGAGYIVFPNVTVEMLIPRNTEIGPHPIIVSESPGNHAVRDTRPWEVVNVLLANGERIAMPVKSQEYAEWADRFAAGDAEIAVYPPPKWLHPREPDRGDESGAEQPEKEKMSESVPGTK